MGLTRLLILCCKLFVSLFVFVAVLDTTNRLFIAPIMDSLLCALHLRTTAQVTEQELLAFALDHSDVLSAERLVHPPQTNTMTGYPWRSSQHILDHRLGHVEPAFIDQNRILSKLFSGSMQPSNIVPYFYRAKRSFNKNAITITTLVTSNRLEVFSRLVEKYEGICGSRLYFSLFRHD